MRYVIAFAVAWALCGAIYAQVSTASSESVPCSIDDAKFMVVLPSTTATTRIRYLRQTWPGGVSATSRLIPLSANGGINMCWQLGTILSME